MRWLNNNYGDTLVEVIFALVILSSILVTTLSIGRVSRVSGQNSQLRTQTINMVQEQYEALKSYRDHVTFANFVSGLRTAATDPVINPTCNLSAPSPACVVHMERDPRQLVGGAANPNYGNWAPCPGSWNPPLDADDGASGWTSRTYCSGATTVPPLQPNITVKIQALTDFTVCQGVPPPNFAYAFPFQIDGTWQQGGIKSSNSTSLNAIIANTKGDQPC